MYRVLCTGPRGPKNLGDGLVDRRKEPFCPYRLNASQTYKGHKRFVFVVSNGHTGTQFLGNSSTWRRSFGNLTAGHHIMFEQDADQEEIREIPKSLDFCNHALKYVIEKKIPYMEGVLKSFKQQVRPSMHMSIMMLCFSINTY